jgi:cell shape-determining protein MreC
MGTKKIITEMMNTRLNNKDSKVKEFMEIIMKKFGGLEKENAELREKLNEIQVEIRERNTYENQKRQYKSSESDEDHPRKKKSSGSSSSDEDNNRTTIQKVCAQEVLEKLREPVIEAKNAEGKI